MASGHYTRGSSRNATSDTTDPDKGEVMSVAPSPGKTKKPQDLAMFGSPQAKKDKKEDSSAQPPAAATKKDVMKVRNRVTRRIVEAMFIDVEAECRGATREGSEDGEEGELDESSSSPNSEVCSDDGGSQRALDGARAAGQSAFGSILNFFDVRLATRNSLLLT